MLYSVGRGPAGDVLGLDRPVLQAGIGLGKDRIGADGVRGGKRCTVGVGTSLAVLYRIVVGAGVKAGVQGLCGQPGPVEVDLVGRRPEVRVYDDLHAAVGGPVTGGVGGIVGGHGIGDRVDHHGGLRGTASAVGDQEGEGSVDGGGMAKGVADHRRAGAPVHLVGEGGVSAVYGDVDDRVRGAGTVEFLGQGGGDRQLRCYGHGIGGPAAPVGIGGHHGIGSGREVVEHVPGL